MSTSGIFVLAVLFFRQQEEDSMASSRQFPLVLPPAEDALLEQLAKAAGVSRAEYLRQFIRLAGGVQPVESGGHAYGQGRPRIKMEEHND